MKKLLTLAMTIGLATPVAGPIVTQINQKVAPENDLQQIITTQLAAQDTTAKTTALPNYPDYPIDRKANQPFQWYAPTNTVDYGLDAWANDPCSILYDDASHLYYSWMLFRDGRGFPSGWIEMTSTDMNSWRQGEMRIKEGREFFARDYPPAAMGGSVWIDKEGKYFDKGDVVFAISMQECGLMGGAKMTGDSGIAYYVSHGLGNPIYQAGIITPEHLNPTGTDWRDSYLYETDKGLYFAIAADNRLEFWRVNSFFEGDIKKVGEIYVRSIGVEVPNVVRFGENEWYVSCSVQDAHLGGPFQGCEWFLCRLEGEKFVPYAKGFHEYGTEGYAQRVVNPWQSRIAPYAISRSMAANWTYNTDIWGWRGGCYGSEKLTIRDNKAYLEPFDPLGDLRDNGTFAYKIKGRDLIGGYQLRFDKGDFTFFRERDKIIWKNDVDTGLNKWTTTGGFATDDDDLTIIINKCTLTFYDETQGWNAHFMLPEGVVHYKNDKAMSILPTVTDSWRDVPYKWYTPVDTKSGQPTAWANDPCSILYDEKSGLYYSWMLFRDGRGFPSDWVEMTSPDMNSWTQGEVRIKAGREFFQREDGFPPAAMGGSVWIDKEGQYFDKGDVIFAISMQECDLMGGASMAGDSGIAYYVSHGLGQPVYKAGILASKGMNPTSSDWRDSYVYQTDDGLYFAISAHDRLEFWRINSFRPDDITKVDEIYVRPLGVEVPNVVRMGENEWFVSCAVQDAPEGGPFQSSEWFLCRLEGEKFIPYSHGVNEYGTEGYAHRVVNPWQSRIAPYAISRAMPGNWNYSTTSVWSWGGGCYGSEKITLNGDKILLTPLDSIGPLSNNGTFVYKLKAKDLKKDYTLQFNKGNFTFFNKDNLIGWRNEVDTGLKKWTSIGGLATDNDDITIIINKCTLTFYNETQGWNAHFMLPQAVKHTPNQNAMSLI